MLGQLVNREGSLNFNDITGVMDAIHQESSSWTIETLVADLVNGVIYLYYFYQFDDPVIINVKEELADPREAGPFSRLFPENVQLEAANRYRQVTKSIRINNVAGRSWSALILFSMILLFIIPPRNKGLRFWIPAVLVLGPFALLTKLLVVNSGKTSIWRSAVIETVGNLMPVIIGYLVALVVMILKTASGGISQQQQALLLLAFPLLASWIIFQSPLLAITGKKNFFKFLFQRLPQVLVTTFLVLGGIFPVSMVLVNRTIAMSQLIPLSPWIVMTWWAIIVAGSLIGGLFVFFYEHWAVKRSYQAWNVYAGSESEVTTPTWGKIWWWIIISIFIFLAGLIAGVMLLKIMGT
jgi:hypothetical protein